MIQTFLNKFILNKVFLFFAFFLIFSIPLINYSNIILLILFIIVLLTIDNFKKNIKIQYIFLIILIASIPHIFDKKTIIENHSIFLPNEKNIDMYLNSNHKTFSLLQKEFRDSYSKNDFDCKDQPHNCWKDVSITQIYAKSFDQFNFGKFKYSRKIKNINHNNLANARIGDINTVKFNWFNNSDYWWDKTYPSQIKRINAPYIIQYIFNNYQNLDNKICWQGKAIINDQSKIINHNNYKCQNIAKNLNILFFNFNNPLKIKLVKSYKEIIFDSFFQITKISSLLLLLFFSIKKINFKKIINIGFISFLSSLSLIYTIINKKEFTFGYNPLQGGMDGLVHEGFGRNILNSLLNFDFFEAFRGSEDIFYFMPGLRYFSALEKFFFGDTFFGVYVVLIFFPILFYLFLIKLGFKKNISLIIIIIFIFIKIPHLGFSYHHYIKNFLTLYPETLAIFFFMLTLILNFEKKYFFSGLFCALMVFLRPNYLPVFICLIFYNSLFSYKEHDYRSFFKYLIGSSIIILIPLHNYIYGNGAIVLLTNSSEIGIFENFDERVHPFEYLYVFQDPKNFIFIKDHLLHFITTGQDNLLVFVVNLVLLINIFIFLIFYLNKSNKITTLFCIISIFQLFPSLFYPNQGRYALFSWLLILITNLLISKKYLKLLRKINN
tara:strand:+ start:508 stop:2496 length:1989 start_codon:yes stop_codon:yes gene_type:complete